MYFGALFIKLDYNPWQRKVFEAALFKNFTLKVGDSPAIIVIDLMQCDWELDRVVDYITRKTFITTVSN